MVAAAHHYFLYTFWRLDIPDLRNGSRALCVYPFLAKAAGQRHTPRLIKPLPRQLVARQKITDNIGCQTVGLISEVKVVEKNV